MGSRKIERLQRLPEALTVKYFFMVSSKIVNEPALIVKRVLKDE